MTCKAEARYTYQRAAERDCERDLGYKGNAGRIGTGASEENRDEEASPDLAAYPDNLALPRQVLLVSGEGRSTRQRAGLSPQGFRRPRPNKGRGR